MIASLLRTLTIEGGDVLEKIKEFPLCTSEKQIKYYNVSCAFDIETTSFEVFQSIGNDKKVEKRAIMYIWTLSLDGVILQGRSWKEFVDVCEELTNYLKLDIRKRLVIYVHNLSFEFQFMHKWFEWEEVFSLKKRQPIKAITTGGIEFRCSYKLSGYSLEKLGDNLVKYKIEKMVGDLDYSKIRNSKTIMSSKELRYCINDVLVVTAYIREYIERVKYIFRIPQTKTGEVRNFARKECFYGGGSKKKNYNTYREYHDMISVLKLTPSDYIQLKKAFSGGFTHANALYSGEIIKNVKSMDFTSSYPYVMISEKFPMSSPKKVAIKSKKQFKFLLKNYCCVFNVEFTNIKATKLWENYISKSHCSKLQKGVLNNGRVVSAESLSTTITELDFIIINTYYTWDSMKIGDFRYMLKGYLPTNFVKAILELYGDKTTLKGVENREIDYLLSKERINSMYGMTVTDICRDKIIYSPTDWNSEKPNIEEAVEKNNTSRKRFLYYAWGVWVTAYARYNLFTAITELGEDYIYSDTDSVKFINYEKHSKYFDCYNKSVIRKLIAAMKYHKLSFDLTCPKNNKGEVKQIGIWDDEGTYSRFKTLGAKRYMTEKNGEISITVAGLNKYSAVPYMKKRYGEHIFESFDNGLKIPSENTGKLTHTYIDNEFSGILTDYQGNTSEYYEKSAIHLGPAEYSLSLDDLYIKYLIGIRDEEV